MFLEYGTFQEKLSRERAKRQPRKYEQGTIYSTGGDNRVEGQFLERDLVLGREVRMDLTATRLHILREAHPDAVAANARDESEADPRWTLPHKPGEFLCNTCGCPHPNPLLAHTYRSCPRCSGVLTPTHTLHEEVLQERRADAEKRAAAAGGSIMASAESWKPSPMYILAAALGHPRDASKAVDVAPALRAQVRRLFGGRTGIDFKQGTNVVALLCSGGTDPSPGEAKALRVRYEVVHVNSVDWDQTGSKAEVRVSVDASGLLLAPLSIRTPSKVPLVKVGKAIYGHPLGAKRGRGAFDVSEQLQGRVDASDGQHLELKHTEELLDLFDDPSPGMKKELVLDYELMGIGDSVQGDEMKDYMVHNLGAALQPKLAPLILVRHATFGVTKAGAATRWQQLKKKLYDLSVVENRKRLRLPVPLEKLAELREVPALEAEMAALNPETLQIGNVDVTHVVQRLIDGPGQGRELLVPPGANLRQLLELTSPDLDLVPDYTKPMSESEKRELENTTLSHCPFKQLRVEYTVTGHDSEQRTSSEERTSTGFDRNFIRYRPGFLQVQCRDDHALSSQVKEVEPLEDGDDDDTSERDAQNDNDNGGSVAEGMIGSSNSVASSITVGSGANAAAASASPPSQQPDSKRRLKKGREADPLPEPSPCRTTETVHVYAETVFPVMKIERALYGHHTNPRRQVDVKSEIEDVVEKQGRQSFNVDPSMNLQKLLKVNPLRGYRKLLKVGYVARGLTGTMRLPDVGGKLVADVYIGYPPQLPPEPLQQLGPSADATTSSAANKQLENGTSSRGGGGSSAPPTKVGLSTAGRKSGAGKPAKPNKYEEFMDDEESPTVHLSNKGPGGGNNNNGGSTTPPPKIISTKSGAGDDNDDDDYGDDIDGPSDLPSLDESRPLSDEKGLLVPISGLASFGSRASVGSRGDGDAEPTRLDKSFEQQANESSLRGNSSSSSSSSSSSGVPSSWTPSTRRQAKTAKKGVPLNDVSSDEAAQKVAAAREAKKVLWGPPRPRVSAGGLIGRRVVVVGSSSEALNGRRGMAISFVESGCHYTVELDPEVPVVKKKKKKKKKKKDAFGYEVDDGLSESEGEEGNDEEKLGAQEGKEEGSIGAAGAAAEPEPSASAAPAGKRKFVRLIGTCLVDEEEPGNEEPEEDPAAKAKREAKELRKSQLKLEKKKTKSIPGLMPCK